MARLLSNLTGWQTLILIFGGFAVVLAALVFVPTEAGSLLTWIGDLIRSILQSLGGTS